MNDRIKKIKHEIIEHLPFTFFASILGILIVILILFLLKNNVPETIFNIIHPAHIFASAIITSAIFYKYKKKILLALLIGIVGSIVIGTISDILLPFLGGLILGLKPIFHLPTIELPFLIISTALLGSLLGIITKITKMPHFIHVFLSVFASIFYLLSFTTNTNTIYLILSVIIIFIAVLIPCCISDIIFPILFTKKDDSKQKNGN